MTLEIGHGGRYFNLGVGKLFADQVDYWGSSLFEERCYYSSAILAGHLKACANSQKTSASCQRGFVSVSGRWEIIREAEQIFSRGRGRLDNSLGASL